MRKTWISAGLACLAAATIAGHAAGQAWPAKPVRVVVTFPPGGSSDVVARQIAPLLAEKLGQSFVVDNKPGAGATIGGAEVARAAPDGYTLMLSNTAPISLSPFMLDPMPYDPVKSFTHVAYIGSVPNVFVVHPSVPAKTLSEFVAWAKQQKGPINYGSGGIGSIGHIVGELFKAQAGIELAHVGYRGSGPMHNDLLGGTILFAIDTLPQNVQYQKSGKLKLLAVTSDKRNAMAPEVPTVGESGYPKLVADNFFGISGPAGMPRPVVDALNKAAQAALADPRLTKSLEDFGIAPGRMSPEEFTAFVQQQVSAWGPAVKASGAKLN
ncbi:MAG: tripartite tricarboxylate transporter substrate binding protein [Betaproteobacteria bacterium]|nr:tripartite tricarboxylate transporter substrate binding protein [Betaproteobacteria bacterium]